jgi:hypothetical protein
MHYVTWPLVPQHLRGALVGRALVQTLNQLQAAIERFLKPGLLTCDDDVPWDNVRAAVAAVIRDTEARLKGKRGT